MLNENSTAGYEQVSQDRLEALFKLAHSGSSPDAISFALKIDIETVQQIIANDPKQMAREVESIKKRSAKYRCAKSNRLMISPVMARDENLYEQSILEADPTLSRDQVMPSTKLRAKIADFSKESLKVLEGYLRQKDPQEDILQLTAECLSVLIPNTGLESALRVLGAVEGETLRKLTGKLRSLVHEEMLIGLLSQLARQLPSHALCLAAQIILEPLSERVLEEAFRCFAELLSQVALDAGAIDLAEEVSERVSRSQLSQMNAALGARPSEGGDRLDGLRLKEAYALLREGEVEAAICLVNTLHITPHLEKEVLRFFDEAGLSSGKVPILEQKLSAKLEEFSRDSPSIAEALSILHQLHKAALQSHKSHDAHIQRLEDQTQRREADDKETLSSLRAMAEALTEEFVKAEEDTSQVKRAQDTQIQRLDKKLSEVGEAMQESQISLRAELRALHEQTAKSEEEAKRVQNFIEQSQKAEAVAQEVLNNLRREVGILSKDLAQVANQCTANEATLKEQSQKAEATTQEVLFSLKALTGDHLKAGEEIKQVKSAQDAQSHRLNEKLNEAETRTRQALDILRGGCRTLREDLGQALSQCKQVQEVMLQRLEEQSQKTEANALKLNRAETLLQDTLYHEVTLPTFIYSYKKNTRQLHRTSLVTGEHSSHQVQQYNTFTNGCCWSEVLGGSLLITGGIDIDEITVSDAVRIDVGTFEASRQRDMHTPRREHAAVYRTPHLYVLGGWSGSRSLSECERYFCAEDRWEALPPLRQACSNTSGVVIERSLYALGGYNESDLDVVQKLSLDSLTWELMQFRLPHAVMAIPCLKLRRDTEVYLVVNNTLCSFTGFEVRPLKNLTEDIQSWFGASYYHRGTIYCSSYGGAVHSYEIGSLSN
jgi:hypothetical protein